MREKDDGGPAFARSAFDNDNIVNKSQEGMSLRDYFAAKAMASMIHTWRPNQGVLPADEVARSAYQIASSMLAVRDTHPKKDADL